MNKLKHFRGTVTPTAIPHGSAVLPENEIPEPVLDVELAVQVKYSPNQNLRDLCYSADPPSVLKLSHASQ